MTGRLMGRGATFSASEVTKVSSSEGPVEDVRKAKWLETWLVTTQQYSW